MSDAKNKMLSRLSGALPVVSLQTMEQDYYEDAANVESYSKFTPAHDGELLVDALGSHLPEGATVLELGLGPGKDYKLLSERFQVTGSDFSNAFLERYRAIDPAAELLQLDARTLETDRRFDAIFSNKVLIHFSPEELQRSFARQHDLLNDDGLLLHSFWYGEGQQEFQGLTLVRHNEQDLTAMLEGAFDILALERHAKMAEGDSIYVVARKKSV
jgi:cyclopropane fatty-acyl-phospholipid synthase-like methyltransferase